MPRDRVWRWRPSELRPLRDSGHPLQTAEYRKAVPEAEDREKFFSSSFQTVAAVLTAASHQLRVRAIALRFARACASRTTAAVRPCLPPILRKSIPSRLALLLNVRLSMPRIS